ncbi:MAG: ROK family transcriptional regulator [Anaerolineae bacterium]|nr:ROK family transcriptional regulator [Anaerolineae bacterium]
MKTHPVFYSNNAAAAGAPFLLSPPEYKVVEAIRQRGPLSRTDIADEIGYSRSKITSVVNSLTSTKILQEVGDGESSGGRRPRVLNFNPDFGYVVGIDMGATSMDITLANFKGSILDRQYIPMDVREGPDVILGLIRKVVLERLESCQIPIDKVYGFGIGVPGPVEFSTGLLIAPPIMPGWEAYPIAAYMKGTFPYAVVIIDNDVNVMALGELRVGAGINEENFIFIKVGTGIGCGIVCNGQIYRGSNGCAGDIGHICADQNGPVCHCGNIGCLEAIAAGPPIAARATQAARADKSAILNRLLEAHDGLTAEDVGVAASQGDRVANEIIQDSGRMIGEVLAGLVNFFNPSLILIGGGVSNIGHQFLASIRRGVLHRSLPLSTRHLRIDTSSMGADAGVIGAISLALEHVFIMDGQGVFWK